MPPPLTSPIPSSLSFPQESIGVQPIGGGSVSLSLAAAGLPPLHSKLAHLLGIVVSAVIALCVGIVLADGTSVVKLRHPSELPQITARAYWNQGLKYRIDELLGPTYGIGLHHDQSGFVWTEVHAGSTLQELIEDLGVPAVIAAVPSVIETDGLHVPPLHTSTAPLPYAHSSPVL